jgi:hypothetical protein
VPPVGPAQHGLWQDGGIRTVLVLALVACGGKAPASQPAAPQVALAEDATYPLRDDAPYPLRYEHLSERVRAARSSELAARNPGWTVTLDEYGFLISAQSATTLGDETVGPTDLSVFQEFIDRNADVLGLEASVHLATLPKQNVHPASSKYQLVYMQPMTKEWFGAITMRKLCSPHEGPHAGCAKPTIEGHAWPHWIGLPRSKSDRELVAPYLERQVAFVDERCRDPGTCSGRDACVETVKTGTEPLTADLVHVERRLQQFTDPKTHAIELRLHAMMIVKSATCTERDRDEQRVVRRRHLAIPWSDAITGQPLSP